MVKNLLRSAVLKLVLKLATYVDFTIASDRLFQTSTILQLKIFPSITTQLGTQRFYVRFYREGIPNISTNF